MRGPAAERPGSGTVRPSRSVCSPWSPSDPGHQGARVLVEEDPPNLLERIDPPGRLLHHPGQRAGRRDGVHPAAQSGARRRVWRVVRVAAVVGITITGVVHWFFLRPLLDLAGWSYLCDKLLHVVVPLLAVVGWLLFGPRPRVTLGAWLLALIWPAAWLAYTLVRGAVTGFYPYPFLNVAGAGRRVGGRRFARDHRACSWWSRCCSGWGTGGCPYDSRSDDRTHRARLRPRRPGPVLRRPGRDRRRARAGACSPCWTGCSACPGSRSAVRWPWSTRSPIRSRCRC